MAGMRGRRLVSLSETTLVLFPLVARAEESPTSEMTAGSPVDVFLAEQPRETVDRLHRKGFVIVQTSLSEGRM